MIQHEHHILLVHQYMMKTCKFCGSEAPSKEELTTHILNYHNDQGLLTSISEGIAQVSKSFHFFEVFKNEFKGVLNNIIGGHNAMMHKMFVFRNRETNLNLKTWKTH